MLFLFNLLTCLVITFVTPAVISGASNVQISVGNSECSRSCCSSKISYVAGTQKVTWSQAFVLCKQAGMELASIETVDEENILENYTKTLDNKGTYFDGYWIAGTRNGACNSDFGWFTTGKPVIYRKFSPGEPNNDAGNEACLELFLNLSNNYWSWNDVPCDFKLNFICQSSKCCL